MGITTVSSQRRSMIDDRQDESVQSAVDTPGSPCRGHKQGFPSHQPTRFSLRHQVGKNADIPDPYLPERENAYPVSFGQVHVAAVAVVFAGRDRNGERVEGRLGLGIRPAGRARCVRFPICRSFALTLVVVVLPLPLVFPVGSRVRVRV